jgi:DNA repair photolyase
MHYVENPPNPWLAHSVEWIGEPPEAKLEVFEETATRRIITHNDSPDVGFDYTVNCYRGCIHGCTYCFSRPTHEYLGYGAGTDFDRKIVVKVNAPKLLRQELMKPSWKEVARAVEPYAPLPEARFHAMADLAAAGITVGIGIAPVIPGLSSELPILLKRAKEAGATLAFINMLRLPGSVAPYFEERLREKLPTKADRVLNRIREARDGKLNSSQFGERMRGKGEYWAAIERLFRIHSERLGFNKTNKRASKSETTFRRPTAQASLFS